MITPEQFAEQRHPRRGNANPERMDMPVWEWLVRTGESAYQANERFGGRPAGEVGPGWCFDRFGCSTTELPDGRVVHIAGEHEDHYDPDFYIYNDVIVRDLEDRVQIFGYPEDVFPPTDFHSATRIGDRICVIGSLGYPELRTPGSTPVHVLDLDSFAIEALATSGDCPGWIHMHTATPIDGGSKILVQRGVIENADGMHFDNLDDYELCLETGVWQRLTERPWQQWAVHRIDGEDLLLFRMSCAAFSARHPEIDMTVDVDAELGGLSEAFDVELDDKKALEKAGRNFDLAIYEQLFSPSVAERTPDEEFEYPVVARVDIGAATVRYVDNGRDVRIKIEGTLPDDTVRRLCDDLVEKLSALQNAECEAVLEGRSP